MMKLMLPDFGQDSWEKTIKLGKVEGRRKRARPNNEMDFLKEPQA